MASSKVMASRSPPNPDLPRQSTPSPLNLHSSDHASGGLGSCNMDDLFRNIYSDSDNGNGEMVNGNGSRTVDEVWRDIVSGGGGGGGNGEPEMTLEVFLAKAGAVNKEDVRVPPPVAGFGIETAMMSPATGVPAVQFAPGVCGGNGGFGMEFGNGMTAAGGGGGRGKRRAAVEEAPVDKATQQKQRRMIKNRESAARSRERKQAYTVELESLVTQLENDNTKLLKEEAESNKKRYKQLMENLIPVVEKRKPRRVLRRVHSMEW